MSREIRFRIWDTEKSQFADKDSSDFAQICWLDNNGIINTLDKNFVFQQFTGLEDNNGKGIYEGDIVKWNFKLGSCGGYDQFFTVKWHQDNPVTGNSLGGFKLFGTKRNKENPHLMTCGMSDPDIEVIGNIFENPELIK